jgi:hypothetical protein
MEGAGDWESLETGSRWRLGVAGDWESVSRDGNSCRPRNSPKPLFRSSPYLGMYGKVFRPFFRSFFLVL